ncbi:MAG: hypothetical protein WEC12_06830 [Balneolaceae bacterium]
MKRAFYFVFTGLIVLFHLSGFNQPANAQFVTDVGDITMGAGISQGSSVGHLGDSEFGVTMQIFYGISEQIRGGGGYTYYFIGEDDLGANEFNFDGHYLFRNRDNALFYGLAGINISRILADGDTWENVSDRRFGLNAGVGLEYDLGNFSLFGEPKFTIGGWSQFLITAGARLRI